MNRRGFFRMVVAAPIAAVVALRAKPAPLVAPLAFHRDAFSFVMSPLPLPAGMSLVGMFDPGPGVVAAYERRRAEGFKVG